MEAASIEAPQLADRRDDTGRRLTAVDELIDETVAGDVGLATKFGAADSMWGDAWEALARDLARQVIDAEAEIDAIEAEEGPEPPDITRPADVAEADASGESRRFWYSKWLDEARTREALAIRLEAEEQAHCETYLEACRLTNELAGWQDSATANYRKATAAARLAEYGKRPY